MHQTIKCNFITHRSPTRRVLRLCRRLEMASDMVADSNSKAAGGLKRIWRWHLLMVAVSKSIVAWHHPPSYILSLQYTTARYNASWCSFFQRFYISSISGSWDQLVLAQKKRTTFLRNSPTHLQCISAPLNQLDSKEEDFPEKSINRPILSTNNLDQYVLWKIWININLPSSKFIHIPI